MEVIKSGFSWAINCYRDPDMPDRDTVLLTPYRQYKKYKHFPSRIIVHSLVVVFVTIQALMISSEFIPYNSANEATFSTIFLPEEYREGIYTIGDCLDVIKQTVYQYYAFPDFSVDRYAHFYYHENGEQNPVITPPKLTIYRYKELVGPFWNHTLLNPDHAIDDDDFEGDYTIVKSKVPYNLTLENPLGPLNITTDNYELQNAFYHITKMEIQFSFRSINVGPLAVLPFYWDIYLYFDIKGGQIDFRIFVDLRIIHTEGISNYDIFTAMTTILLISTLLSLFFSLQTLYNGARVYTRIKNKYKKYSTNAEPSDYYPTWNSVPFFVKPHFFSLWDIFNSVGCICLIIACILGLAEEFGYSTSEYYMVGYGIGCMLACFNIIRYFQYSKILFLHVQTLRNAASHIISFCISVAPIYWGYAIFGVLNFGPYLWKFSNLDEASVTLFALLTGDDIHDTFKDIVENAYPLPMVSRIYIYSFVTIFITTVLNVFIFIIEDAYHMAKHTLGMSPSIGNDGTEGLHDLQAEDILHIIFNNLELWQKKRLNSENVYSNPDLTIPLHEIDHLHVSPAIQRQKNLIYKLQSQSSTNLFSLDSNNTKNVNKLKAFSRDNDKLPKNANLESDLIESVISKHSTNFINEINQHLINSQNKFIQNVKSDLLQLLSNPNSNNISSSSSSSSSNNNNNNNDDDNEVLSPNTLNNNQLFENIINDDYIGVNSPYAPRHNNNNNNNNDNDDNNDIKLD